MIEIPCKKEKTKLMSYEWKQQNLHQENYNHNKLITNYFFNDAT